MAEDDRRVRVLSWNLFHGRDHPPDPALFTLRSRLLGRTERNETHLQVNRSLRSEFARVLAGEKWDVAFLQEAPPAWLGPLCREAGSSGASGLTSRNLGAPLRRALAAWNPDLLASGEGGSNQILVRPPWRIVELRRVTLARLPERRRMLWALLAAGGSRIAVANLHASAHRPWRAGREVAEAAASAAAWAGPWPLLFGGDLNLRPELDPEPFELLRRAHRMTGVTSPRSVDHLLSRDLTTLEPAHALPPARREIVAEDGLRVRLSDHHPVIAAFGVR